MSSAEAPISPNVISQKIVELRARVSSTEDELNRLRTELEWWETGQRLFGEEDGEMAENGATPPESAPSAKAPANGKKPTLREAIFFVLGQEPRKTWKAEAVIKELRRRDWIPSGENAEHHTRSMLAQMHRKGQARRMSRGAYRLPPDSKDSP
jgi:hypothetical protein